jgi:hypothetical protein
MASRDARETHDRSLTEPVSAPPGHATSENVKADAETLGETSGGFLGAAGGIALGAMAGPVGAVLGGLAGALGGWWAGRGIAETITADDEAFFRSHHGTAAARAAGDFERVRPAYVAGHLAGRNPDYGGRSFEEVEGDLRCGWGDDVVARCGEWPVVRDSARAAFERARAGAGAGARPAGEAPTG